MGLCDKHGSILKYFLDEELFVELAEHAEGCVVVGLVGDLINKLPICDVAVAVNYDDGARKQPGKRTVDKLDSKLLGKQRRAES